MKGLLVISLATAAALSGSTCQPLDSDRILARHLAAALPAFAGLAPDLPLGYAPFPGHQRVFQAEELQRLAATHSVSLPQASGVCFEWPMEAVSRESIVQAMRDSLGDIEGHVEIAELSSLVAPRGAVVFPRTGLLSPAAAQLNAPAVWKGYVLYGGTRKFAITAKVLLLFQASRAVAQQALRVGEVLDASNIRLEKYQGLPQAGGVNDLDQLVGQSMKRSVQAGAVVTTAMTEKPAVIAKGDSVRVEVRSGFAQLRLDGKAEAPARLGDFVPVRNESSGKTFRARVTAPGLAVVVVD